MYKYVYVYIYVYKVDLRPCEGNVPASLTKYDVYSMDQPHFAS